MEERLSEAFADAEQLTVIGKRLQPGEPAPDFCLSLAGGEVEMDPVLLIDALLAACTVMLIIVWNTVPVLYVYLAQTTWKTSDGSRDTGRFSKGRAHIRHREVDGSAVGKNLCV